MLLQNDLYSLTPRTERVGNKAVNNRLRQFKAQSQQNSKQLDGVLFFEQQSQNLVLKSLPDLSSEDVCQNCVSSKQVTAQQA